MSGHMPVQLGQTFRLAIQKFADATRISDTELNKTEITGAARMNLLLQITEPDSFLDFDAACIGTDFTKDYAEQRRLAGTVRPDQTYPVPLINADIYA
jgi:hypothetical protein